MKYIKLRWFFDLLKVLKCALRNEDYCIEVVGWKRTTIFPVLMDMELNVEIINKDELQLDNAKPKLSLRAFILGMYVGPVYSFIETEVDRGKHVVIDCGTPAKITITKS